MKQNPVLSIRTFGQSIEPGVKLLRRDRGPVFRRRSLGDDRLEKLHADAVSIFPADQKELVISVYGVVLRCPGFDGHINYDTVLSSMSSGVI